MRGSETTTPLTTKFQIPILYTAVPLTLLLFNTKLRERRHYTNFDIQIS